MIVNIGLPGILLLLITSALIVIPFWKLWSRTGHSGWISLLMLVPAINVIMLYVLAFKAWPIASETTNT